MSTLYQKKNGVLIYAGINSADYNLWIQGGGTYSAPAKRHKVFPVAGRNGTLTLDEGAYEEVRQVYPVFIAEDFADSIAAFRNEIMLLSGYQRLEDSYHPDEYFMARYMSGLEPDVAPRAVGGTFDLAFERDPRRFLKQGEEPLTIASGDTIYNPTQYPARPLIKVTGSGTLTVGGDVITVASGQAYMYIDSEIQDCYVGTTNCNNLVTFSNHRFPVLPAGETGITFTGFTAVEITPRWWRL